MSNLYETSTAYIEKTEHILYVRVKTKSTIDAKEAAEITEIASTIFGEQLHANLVDVSQMLFMTRAARQHFAEQNKGTVVAIAIIMNSQLQTSMGNIYMKFSNPRIQTKLFTNKDEALDWLNNKIADAIKH